MTTIPANAAIPETPIRLSGGHMADNVRSVDISRWTCDAKGCGLSNGAGDIVCVDVTPGQDVDTGVRVGGDIPRTHIKINTFGSWWIELDSEALPWWN